MIHTNLWRDRAASAVGTFLTQTPSASVHFPHLDRDTVGNGLLERIGAPGKIRQGPAGLCGPAALLFDLASHDPEAYAQFGINLFDRGAARIKKLEVKPNRALKIAPSPPGMEQVDWLMMASIRNSANTIFFDYDAPSGDWNQFKGMTLPGEMTKWFRQAGYTQVIEQTSTSKIFSMSAENAKEASAKFMDGWHVFLFINANMLNFHTEHISGTLPDHWVKLMSKIELDPNSVKFKVYSWGSTEGIPTIDVPGLQSDAPPQEGDPPKPMERQPNHSFTQDMFLKNYFGYIAARL